MPRAAHGADALGESGNKNTPNHQQGQQNPAALSCSDDFSGICRILQRPRDNFNFFNVTWLQPEHAHFVPLPRVQVQVVKVVHPGLLKQSRAWLKPPAEGFVFRHSSKRGWAYPVSASKDVSPVPDGGAGVSGARGRGLALGKGQGQGQHRSGTRGQHRLSSTRI